LRASRRALVASVARELGVARYSVYQILRMAIGRCGRMDLWVRGNRRDAVRHARWMLLRLVTLYERGASPQLAV
ncbi:MAG: hypothetical protein WCE48_05590, partial [Steroidobacteraceae bacterium]